MKPLVRNVTIAPLIIAPLLLSACQTLFPTNAQFYEQWKARPEQASYRAQVAERDRSYKKEGERLQKLRAAYDARHPQPTLEPPAAAHPPTKTAEKPPEPPPEPPIETVVEKSRSSEPVSREEERRLIKSDEFWDAIANDLYKKGYR
jgi:hypothetical protein